MTGPDTLKGLRLLVVEDEYLLADQIARRLMDGGAEVVGPVGDIDDALDLLDGTTHLDGAVLDLNLHGEMAYPVADALLERGIPFVFATGYDGTSIPARYKAVTRFEKPVDPARLARVLFAEPERT